MKTFFFFGSSYGKAKESSVVKLPKSCYFKTPYYSENLTSNNNPILIRTKEQKRELMKQQNLEEF